MMIRDLRIEDYDDMVKIWEESGLSYRPKGRDSREEIERQLKLPTSIFLAAEKDGKLAGVLLGTHSGRKGWINRLAVEPKFQKQGVARTLVSELEKRCFALGIGIIGSMVEDWNKASAEVFDRLGYERFDGIIYFRKRINKEI
jgi:ribosomal protein S18 acetylase RimI-like enzyme